MENFLPKCDKCHRRAVMFCCDVYEQEPDNGWKTYRPGPLKAGCALHPVRSMEYDRNGKLLGPSDRHRD